MASSSVSQEDVDNDYELSSRRTRIRTARACRNANPPPPSTAITSSSSINAIPPSAMASRINDHHNLGCGADHPDDGNGDGSLGSCLGGGELRSTEGADHNDASPKPLGRAKEKRVNRANHLNKGKQQRDRRKLREKRRSTGVVHLPSTESTGGSTGEDEDEGGATGGVISNCPLAAETRRNTHHNEHLLLERTGAPDGSAPSESNAVDSEDRVPVKQFTQRRNKSPSDLEADDEDNQEFDSLNQSDSATGSAPHPPTSTVTVAPLPPLHHPHHAHHHHHHHHHHRHQSGSSQSMHSNAANSTTAQQSEKVPNGNRPGTPTGENMEELLERAQEENRRLLRLLEERDRRIASLEARVSALREEKEEILRSVARGGKPDFDSDGEVPSPLILEGAHGERVLTEEGEGISKV
ncbi:siderophore biosynthesis regulatory protein URBS1-like [Ischnura elegans]|uniref:siderophore biosynthesis regulatory protein URBS1-like n=1 Tax=Ischnura elegans TaxID=197161 RepID=UPI001ED8A332|nr:siderophore biosynthesis regulatory protein URBS1-like [Ischnura elegans]XP_046405381.1 siderophore biosynthesis regulatory protein URBS1-like [Ischnura elegans]